jgi:2'-hydroxyisoflavone reductase
MRLLILGGTGWLGGEIAGTALRQGHHVTCLARGTSGSVPSGAALIRADRDDPDGLAPVVDGRWDAVLDVSRQPGQVRRAVAALHPVSDLYVFVSSGSVYADHKTPNQDEDGPLLSPLEGDVMESMQTYGEAKVASEQHVRTGCGLERSLIARVGLIGGPGDVSDRTGYWPSRFARPAGADGSVLIPDSATSVQLIDVRDLASWLVESAIARTHGTFDVTGPPTPLTDMLRTARTVAGHTGPVVRVPSAWLVEHGVETWMGPRSLPLWLADDPDWAAFSDRDSARARAAGLRTRPLEQTLADTLAWELTRDPDRPRTAGLTAAEEQALLSEYAG